jgi:hypothetical protein
MMEQPTTAAWASGASSLGRSSSIGWRHPRACDGSTSAAAACLYLAEVDRLMEDNRFLVADFVSLA